MHSLFSSFGKWGLLSSCGVWASCCSGFSCCGALALGHVGSLVAIPGLLAEVQSCGQLA